MTQIVIQRFVICLLGADNKCLKTFVREYSILALIMFFMVYPLSFSLNNKYYRIIFFLFLIFPMLIGLIFGIKGIKTSRRKTAIIGLVISILGLFLIIFGLLFGIYFWIIIFGITIWYIFLDYFLEYINNSRL